MQMNVSQRLEIESFYNRPPASSSPIVLAGAFGFAVGCALVLWFLSAFRFLGGAVLSGAIVEAEVAAQRQSAVLILAPLIVSAGIWIWFENEMAKAMKPLTDELEKVEQIIPKLNAPRLKKFE